MVKSNYSDRLSSQHKEGKGVVGIFGNEAKWHDMTVRQLADMALDILEGSNFLTESITVTGPDGRVVCLDYKSGLLNRLDRLTAANYGMPLNTNLCKNTFVTHGDRTVMLQAASIYTQGNGERWNRKEMLEIMMEVARTSLRVLASQLIPR